MNQKPTVRTKTEGRTIAVVGDIYRFVATGADTAGRYAQWESFVPPGGGPPPHVHSREDEGFFIMEGEVVFQINGERVVATAGMFANMPAGVPHSFKNESNQTAKVLITIAPAGLEQMFLEVGQPVPEGSTTGPPPSHSEIEKMMELAARYGVQVLV